MKVMLITGATGTVGGHLVERFHGRYRILAQGRDAVSLSRLRSRHPGIETVCGDLHSAQIAEAVDASRVVLHAAAQRYADIADRHCTQTIDTNVCGTQRLADLATKADVERFVFVSSVDADAPTSVLAMSKYLAERIVLELAGEGCDAQFHICRLGRISAAGDRLHEREAHPDSTRFTYTVEEAGDLIEFALTHAGNGTILIPKMRAERLGDLADMGCRIGTSSATHEIIHITGEIETGHETDLCFILDRHARQKLTTSRLDSSRSGRRMQPRVAA